MKKTTIYNLSQLEFFSRHLICMQKGHVAEFSGTGVGFLGRAVRRANAAGSGRQPGRARANRKRTILR